MGAAGGGGGVHVNSVSPANALKNEKQKLFLTFMVGCTPYTGPQQVRSDETWRQPASWAASVWLAGWRWLTVHFAAYGVPPNQESRTKAFLFCFLSLWRANTVNMNARFRGPAQHLKMSDFMDLSALERSAGQEVRYFRRTTRPSRFQKIATEFWPHPIERNPQVYRWLF
jgi:hypothetical protein